MVSAYSKRYFILPILLFIGFGALSIRACYLYAHREYYVKFASKTRNRANVIAAKRGSIIDRNGNWLAATKRVFDVGVDLTQVVEDDADKLNIFASYINRNVSDLQKLWNLNSQKRWKKLRGGVDESTYDKIRSLKIKGVYGNSRDQRVYFNSNSLGHIIGFVNKEGDPVTGIEQMMHFYLQGQDGLLESEISGKQSELSKFRHRKVDAVDGHNIQLTVDANIQAILEKILTESFDTYSPESVSAIITNPLSGEILALVTLPGFNPNKYWKYPQQFLKNRAVTDVYEPGSVFKIITVGAALNEGVVSEQTKFDCSKTHAKYNDKEVPLPKDWKTFNCEMTVEEILKNSSNRGLAQIGMALGENNLYKYARAFGFGEKTGSVFNGETRGMLREPRYWDGLTITRMPMGHAVSCSLIQMHYAMGAVANGGKLMYPQLIKRVYSNTGEIIRAFSPVIKRSVITKDTSNKLKQILLAAKTSKAYIDGYNVVGKSGTTQKIINGKYSHDKHISSFSAFFPSKMPKVHITLALDSPSVKGTAYGAQIAAPIFKKIAECIIAYIGIAPESEIFSNHV